MKSFKQFIKENSYKSLQQNYKQNRAAAENAGFTQDNLNKRSQDVLDFVPIAGTAMKAAQYAGSGKDAYGNAVTGKDVALSAGMDLAGGAIAKGVAKVAKGVADKSSKVFRIDDKKIKDFSKDLKTYASNKQGTESGTYDSPDLIPDDYIQKTGLYGATNKRDIAGYVFPRGTQNVTASRGLLGKKTTMVIDKKPPSGHTPTLSTFEKTPDWKKTAGSEVFSSSPGKPISQQTINDPMQYAKDQGVRVIVGDPKKYQRRVNNIIDNKTGIRGYLARKEKTIKLTGELTDSFAQIELMKSFSQYITEKKNEDGVSNAKHFFDIDETLFAHDHSKLRVHVKDPSGRRVRTLTNQEFNSHELPAGHSYDFSEFKSSDVFGKSAHPIRKMIAKMKAMKNNGANVEMLTARADLDDKNKFGAHMKKYGIDITPGSGIHVRRAGNTPGKPADTKAAHIADAIQREGLKEVHLYDDSIDNINGMLKLKKQFPDVTFHGHHVQHDPESGRVNITRYSK